MSGATESEDSQINRFVEQAEYLELESFQAWSAQHPDEETILRKLRQSGAKLVTGPRGCGKTTLLLKAYYQMLRDDESAFPVYVNFKTSLKLEPLYSSNANAMYWFNQWLLFRTYLGVYESLQALGREATSSLRYSSQSIKRFIGHLELGQTEFGESKLETTISELQDDIASVCAQFNRPRCVLLLDDAAHAFSPEQQRDFFEFFRRVKSKSISPKAAVYPGVTVYPAAFHVGHDAEEIDVWLKPNSPKYLPFMNALLERRIQWSSNVIVRDAALVNLMCYAAFGMPRALLNIARGLYSDIDGDSQRSRIIVTRFKVLREIKRVFENTHDLYLSLKLKLPMHQTFVRSGEKIYDSILSGVKTYNQEKPTSRQSVTAAIQRPVSPEFQKVLGFFQYSGLLLPAGDVSRGEKGVFDLFYVHYAALITSNAVVGKKSISVSSLVEALQRRHPHEFTRFTEKKLLGKTTHDAAFKLSLPPCQVCRTPRINESAKFCLNCGTQLKSVSVFDGLVMQDLSKLPLTSGRIAKLKLNSRLRTVKDVLMDLDHKELRSVPSVGPFWANRIYAYAEEFIA